MAATKSQKLEDQAATAALHVTQGKNKKLQKADPNYPLDKDGKLSSAGAATSLKLAGPRDLPSFPTVGLANTDSASGAAASLANSNQKNIDIWKPGEIPAASKAAKLAKDYKADPLWQPDLSSAGSKAALIASKKGGDVEMWQPHESLDDAGHSAAGQAMRKKDLSPNVVRGSTKEDERKALSAATLSMAGGRRRAGSTPIYAQPEYPDAANSAANALKAATSVSKGGKPQPIVSPRIGPSIDMSRVHNQSITNMKREMFTANPPVAPEIEEKNRETTLRASAVAMAKQMYDLQQRQIAEAAEMRQSDSHYAATSVHNRPQSSISSEDGRAAPQYANLQEAAQKLAAERLAKLHDEHASYRTYYGTQQAPSKRLSIRGRPRRRASSDGDVQDDEERARQIRNQMSLFTGKLDQVDNKKRQKDRDSLMAVAQRNVRASMTGMDQKVYNETGKISPAMMEEWEAKAKAKAQAESDTRMVNHGRVNIGGGKFLDQSEIDAIAAQKVQPTLDEITAKAEKDRARDEELRQMQLERERIEHEKNLDDKTRSVQTKEEWKRFKEEEKREAKAKKEEEKAKKDAEKAKKAEEKRLEKEKKRKSKDAKAASETLAVVAEKAKEPEVGLAEAAAQEESVAPPVQGKPEDAVKHEEEEGVEEGEEEGEEGEEGEEEDEEEEEEEEEEEGEEEDEEGENIGEEEEDEVEGHKVGNQPPLLGEIPHVASYSAEADPKSKHEETERISPAFIPISEMPPINASQADFPLETSKGSKLEPDVADDNKLDKYVTAESEEQPVPEEKAEEIARRVFAAPVLEEPTETAQEETPDEVKESVDKTANIDAAPVVDADDAVPPVTESTLSKAAPGQSAEPSEPVDETNRLENKPSESSGVLFPPTKTATETSQPEKPVADRIAPPVVAVTPAPASTAAPASKSTPAMTKTTVSGPSKLTKEKDSGGVSGWLKSKFSRRSSKPSKPEPATSSGQSKLAKSAPENEKPKDVVPIIGPAGTAVLTEAPGATSSDPGDSSMRDVAMAGKDKENSTAAAATPPVVSPLRDDGPTNYTDTSTHQQRESSEISSLSSDEDTRGRSNVRLADSLGLPKNEPEGHTSTAHQQPTNKRAGMFVPDMPGSVGKSSTSGGEFEEAKDAFEKDELSPPPAVVPGAEETRTSSSPARDSKFIEAL